MPVIALIGYTVFLALAFGLRTVVHYRNTGTTGFLGLSGSPFSTDWWAGVLFGVAVRRLLRPGGEFHVADWGKPQNALMRLAALSFRISDGADTTGANVRGELPGLIASAGFSDVRETEHRMTPFGTLTYLRARAS